MRILVIILGIYLISFSFILESSFASATRILIFSYLITNPTNLPINRAVFYTYIPIYKTSWQTLERIEYTCKEPIIVDDDLGNSILKCSLPVIPPYGQLPITIRVWIKLKNQPQNIKQTDSNDFLGNEPFIETDTTEIKTLANRLKTKESYTTAKRIYNWIKSNIHFSNYISKPLGALKALKSRYGDCTEGMTLFVALCRSAGIKAKGVAGYVVSKNGNVDPLLFHNWALFYANSRWRIADPKKGIFDSNYNQYVATTIIGKRKKQYPIDIYERFKVIPDILSVKQF